MPKSTRGGRGQTTGGAEQNQQPIGRGVISWHGRLEPAAKFSFWVMIFTAFLAGSTAFQVWAFIQSERALLSMGVVDFKLPDPPYDNVHI